MKNLKNLVERYPFEISLIGTCVLVVMGYYLGKVNPLWFLLDVLAILLCLLMFALQINKEWVCTKCGKKEILGRYKFCSGCGCLMGLKKKEKIFCPRSHRVNKYDRFCSKCGVHLITGRMR